MAISLAVTYGNIVAKGFLVPNNYNFVQIFLFIFILIFKIILFINRILKFINYSKSSKTINILNFNGACFTMYVYTILYIA